MVVKVCLPLTTGMNRQLTDLPVGMLMVFSPALTCSAASGVPYEANAPDTLHSITNIMISRQIDLYCFTAEHSLSEPV